MRLAHAWSVGFLWMMLVGQSNVAIATILTQQTVNYASLSSRVTDPTDAIVAGAQIAARQTDTNLPSTTSTDPDGRFRFPYLKPGAYEITVRTLGFADATRAVTLTLGTAFELAVSLNVASVQTDISVTGQQEILELARTQ